MKIKRRHIYSMDNYDFIYNIYLPIIVNKSYNDYINNINNNNDPFNQMIRFIENEYESNIILKEFNYYLKCNYASDYDNNKVIKVYVNDKSYKYFTLYNNRNFVHNQIKLCIFNGLNNENIRNILKEAVDVNFFKCNFRKYINDPVFKVIVYCENDKSKRIVSNIKYKNNIIDINDFIVEYNYYNDNDIFHNIVDVNDRSILYYDKEVLLNI